MTRQIVPYVTTHIAIAGAGSLLAHSSGVHITE
jgi:hypothetical protein